MEVVDRSQLLSSLEAYSGANGSSILVASATRESEEVLLQVLDRLAESGSGVLGRVGFNGFVAVSTQGAANLEALLKEKCEGIWCHVITPVASHKSLADALREVEWRALKWVAECEAMRVAYVP